MLKFVKMSSDFSREVLKFVKLGSQKCWVYDNSQKKVVESVGFMTMPVRGSFSEMFDSLARITDFGSLRTRARTHGRTDARNKGL